MAPDRFVRTERWDDWDPGETLVTTELVEHNGITTMRSSMVFPSQEVRDVVLKGGLTQKGTDEFYARLDELLKALEAELEPPSFDRVNLADAVGVAAAFKRRLQERADDFSRA